MKSLLSTLYATALIFSSVALSYPAEASTLLEKRNIVDQTSRLEPKQSGASRPSQLKEEDDFDNDNLSILCENSPLNSRCKDWEPIVSLEDRPGEKTDCQISPAQVNVGVSCKVGFVEGAVVAYIERTGGRPAAIGGERGTLTVSIPQEQIFSRFTSRTITLVEGSGPRTKVMVELGFTADPSDKAPNRTGYLKIVTSKENLLEQFYSIDVPDLTSAEEQNDFRTAIAASPVSAADNISRLLETKACVRCDLSGADLSEASLAGANLEGANLTNANLSKANLDSAYLVGATLDGADLTETNLNNSLLALASFSNTTNFTSTSLSSAALVLTDLRNTRLKDAVLRPLGERAWLTVARMITVLAYSDLSNVDLSGAVLNGVNFDGANLENIDLSNATLDSLPVNASVTTLIAFVPVEFPYLFSLPTRFEKSNLRGANLSGASLKLASLETADLSGANLTAANFDKAYLVDTNLSNALLQDTRLTTINMSGANLTGTDLSTSNLDGSTLCNTTMSDGAVSNNGCER